MAKQNNRNYVDREEGAPEAADVHDPDNVMSGHEEDERLYGSKSAVVSRESQAREVAPTGNLSREDEERLTAFRDSVYSSAMPRLPEEEGYHICWLTTTNPRDSIAMRQRLGYQLLRSDKYPGFEHSSLGEGPFKGYIGVNEMVAARIPMHLYLAYMQEAHHNAPQREEQRLRAVTETIAEQAREASGRAPVVGDGTAALGRGPARGKFEE